MSTSPDIFLSYSRHDVATTRRFAQGLEREGFSVWWDASLRAGESFDQVIETALRSAKAVVVLWSKTSVASRWVRAEATMADRNKTLVPVMIEGCERPIMFELTQTADLAHWQGDSQDRTWRVFLADVRRLVASAPAPPVALPAAGPAAASGMTTPGIRGEAPSLAVLPFTNRSGLAEDEVFAIGMVEDLIDAMSQGVFVRVVSSAATAAFRTGSVTDLAHVARQLGVRYLLEGNVRRVASTLRVTSQLVEAASGAILWTRKFDRSLTELAALQEELVLEVAAHLGTKVHQVEMERSLRKPGDLTAWEAVMRSTAARRALNVASMSVSVDEAAKAVAIAPDYGLAHAVLAMGQGLRYLAISPDDANEVRRIRGHVEKAIALEPDNPLVLANVCLALSYLGHAEDGLRLGERAVRVNPGASFVHFACGVACLYLNRIDKSLSHLEADIKASPGAPDNFFNFTYQGNAHMRAERWPDAEAALDNALALHSNFPVALIFKAVICAITGRSAEAHSLLLHTREVEPAGTLGIWELNFRRHLVRCPKLDDLLRQLRALWAEAS